VEDEIKRECKKVWVLLLSERVPFETGAEVINASPECIHLLEETFSSNLLGIPSAGLA
jgi:hypothetical protein